MKILIFGNGYVGSRMAEQWPDAIVCKVRIDDKAGVLSAIDAIKPDAVVNAAGKAGTPNVDWCETHTQETTRSNTIGALVLAEACQERGVYFLHLGTGCVFYGPSPEPGGWKEEDFGNPAAFYTRTKYATDLILSRLPNVAIARFRMPIDYVPSPKNLINKLATYKQIIDVENSVTILEDLISVTRQIIEKRGTGIFHVVNEGTMRHRDLLALYRELVDPTHACEWISEQDLLSRGLALKKRSNNIMQNTRLRALGIQMRPIQIALRETMEKYAAIKRGINPNAPKTFNDLRPAVSPAPARTRQMKGVILAGGKGTRLAPLTNITNKHLLPVAQKQMILYPLQTLLDAGIKNIMLITGPDHAGQFMNLLGSGVSRGCNITYRIQDASGGIAHALAMAEDFVDGDNCTAILGDNIFQDNFSAHINQFTSGALAFYKTVDDPHRFGVMEIDAEGRVLSIEEKPQQPKSAFAQVGLYIFEPSVFAIIKTLKPSARGELEITEVNNAFLAQKKLIARPVRGFWSDAGTFQSLKRANDYLSGLFGAER